MDSHHRHELQQNELGKLTNKAVPFLEKYGIPLAAGVGAAVVAFIVAAVWFSLTTANTAESWAQFDRVLHEPNSTSGEFAAVAEQFPGSAAASWARLKEAGDYLKSGLAKALSNRDLSQSDLKTARDLYQKLADGGAGVAPDTRERALFGLARCEEALSDGNMEQAIATYQRLLREFPESAFQGIANERIQALDSSDAKDFYAWFHGQKIEPQEPPTSPFRKPAEEPSASETGDSAAKEETPATEESSTPADGKDESGEPKPDAESKPSEAAEETKSDAEKTPDGESKQESETRPDSASPSSETPEAESKSPSATPETSESP